MKKKSLFLLAPAILALAACGGNGGEGEGDETSSSEEVLDGYVVRVLNPDGTPCHGVGRVRYCDDQACVAVRTDDNGVAVYDGDPDKVYDVHLTLLEDYAAIYTYDPNGYQVSKDQKSITIKLSNLKTPAIGNGEMYDGPYAMEEGAYRVNAKGLKENGSVDYTFFSFVPNRPGIYKLESWLENTEPYDPVVGLFGNTSAYLYESDFDDDSGSGLNFYKEFEVLEDSFEISAEGTSHCVATYSFGLGAKSECTYDFALSYVRPLGDVEDNKTSVPVTANLSDYEASGTLKEFDLSENDIAVFNNQDKTYHKGSADGEQIVAHILSENSYFAGLGMIAMNQGMTTENGTKDYIQFLETYERYTNDDGVYPLTEELKVLLEEFARAQLYFENGGWISSQFDQGYSFGNQANFLYGCSYYAKDGTADNPRPLDTKVVMGRQYLDLEEGQELFYSIHMNRSASFTFAMDENTTLTYEGETYGEEDELVINVDKDETYILSAKRADGHAGKIYFTYEVDLNGNLDGETAILGTNTVTVDATGIEFIYTHDQAASDIKIYSDDPNCIIVDNDPVFGGATYAGGSGNSFNLYCNQEDVVPFLVKGANGYTGEVTFIIELVSNQAPRTAAELGKTTVTIGAFEFLHYRFTATEANTYTITASDRYTVISTEGEGNVFYGGTSKDGFTVELGVGEYVDFDAYGKTFDYAGKISFTIAIAE